MSEERRMLEVKCLQAASPLRTVFNMGVTAMANQRPVLSHERMRDMHDNFHHCTPCSMPSSCRSALHCALVKRERAALKGLVGRLESAQLPTGCEVLAADLLTAARIIRQHAPETP